VDQETQGTQEIQGTLETLEPVGLVVEEVLVGPVEECVTQMLGKRGKHCYALVVFFSLKQLPSQHNQLIFLWVQLG
jgi:hypothetical protein